MFRCISDGKYHQAMGMAVECRRLDKLEEAITNCDNINSALSYCINLSHQFVNHREYRCEVSIQLNLFFFSLIDDLLCLSYLHIIRGGTTRLARTQAQPNQTRCDPRSNDLQSNRNQSKILKKSTYKLTRSDPDTTRSNYFQKVKLTRPDLPDCHLYI
jgi:hypothetical protein